MGQRTYPGPAGRGGGHPPQHTERKAAQPPRAPRWAWRGCRGADASSPRPGARGPRPQAPETQCPAAGASSFQGSQAAEAAGRDLGSAGSARSAGGQGAPGPAKAEAGGRASWASTGAALRRGTSTHRASVLNDDLFGQHDTAVRGPFLFLPLGHFTILDSRSCSSHSGGGWPQRGVRSRHYCGAEPLRAHAAILRARPASGGASHRAIG